MFEEASENWAFTEHYPNKGRTMVGENWRKIDGDEFNQQLIFGLLLR